MSTITPFLWFNNNAVEAVQFYASVFKDSKIFTELKNNEPEKTGVQSDVLTVSFELNGQKFVALNGGPFFTFNEAISFVVHCKDQDEVDYYWERLVEGGEPSQCGWLKDKYGLSWQITPDALIEYLSDPDPEKSKRAMDAMMKMSKIVIADLKTAHDG